MGVALIGLLSTDQLCATHRVVVQALAGVVVCGAVIAIIGLIHGWPSAPLTTLIACSSAVVIGAIDAMHSTTASRFVVVSFRHVHHPMFVHEFGDTAWVVREDGADDRVPLRVLVAD
jgi:hypothetical protein